MEKKEPFDYKKFRAEIFLKYDIDLDDTALAIMRIVVIQQNISFESQNKKLDQATKNINQAKKSLEVSKNKPKSQAFWFGFGLWGSSICTFIICSCILIIFWQHLKSQELLLPEKLKWYKSYFETLKAASPKNSSQFLKANPMPEQ